MIPALSASITLFALSFVTFSSLLFFAMMRTSPPLRGPNGAEFVSCQCNGQGRKCHSPSSKDDEEEADCEVCQCRFQDGDEITELGCDHVFHMACFNRYMTCPVCRLLIESTEVMFVDNSIKVLTFRLWDFSNRDDHNIWWLR